MNRYLTIFITILFIVAVASGVVFVLLRPNSPAPVVQQSTPPPVSSTVSVSADRSKEAARAALQQAIDRQNIDNTKLYGTSIAGDYALQAWAGDVMGGEALLLYDSGQGRWVIVVSSGGAWRVFGLIKAGVPTRTAEALRAGLKSQMMVLP